MNPFIRFALWCAVTAIIVPGTYGIALSTGTEPGAAAAAFAAAFAAAAAAAKELGIKKAWAFGLVVEAAVIATAMLVTTSPLAVAAIAATGALAIISIGWTGRHRALLSAEA